MTNWRTRKQIAAKSIAARNRANLRWNLDRERRDALANIDPARLGNIVRRIVVIDRETTVREAVIYGFDSARSARRKLNLALTREKPLALAPDSREDGSAD